MVLYDMISKKEILNLKGHSRPVVSLDVHPTEEGRIVSGSADAFIRVWGPSA